MPRYFMGATPLSGLEKMMMQPPGYQPRGGGRRTGYKYSTADCDCQYCLKAEQEKMPCQSPSRCLCFEERLLANCWTHGQLANMLMQAVMSPALSERTRRLLPPSTCSPFQSQTHCHRMKTAAATDREPSPYVAAAFLLSVNKTLWHRAQSAFENGSVDFGRISLRGLGGNEYLLFQTAKDLYHGQCRLTVEELCNPQMIGDELFRPIVSAFVIQRFGLSSNAHI